ncbi:MAG: regulatory protein LysR [Gemmatimonadetes bacterium]|nr:regulatory protein LysR [Gemmatimonadota bacterium]
MELRHLRYLVAIAETSTFVAAAEQLRVAQPALSRQIHDLEEDLGVSLFDRGPKGSPLTAAGEVAVVAARFILRRTDLAFERAREASLGLAGRCVICAGRRPTDTGFIAELVALVHREYPEIHLEITEGTLRAQWDAVRGAVADLGLGLPATADYPELTSETLHQEHFDAALVWAGHPLAARTEISATELAGDCFVTFERPLIPQAAALTRSEFARLGMTPASTREYPTIAAIGAAVAAGQGWTIIPRSLLLPPGTVMLPLSDMLVPIPLAVIYRREEPRPATRTVLSLVRRLGGDEAAQVARPEKPSAQDVTGGPPASTLIELRHLRYFWLVIQEGSIGRAAERLELSQPTLSRQLRDLERVAGVPLLERESRGVVPTVAGAALAEEVRHILDEVQSLPAELERAQRGAADRCVIGTVATPLVQRLVSELIGRAGRELPNMEIVIEECVTPRQAPALRAATLDIGICHASPVSTHHDEGIVRTPLIDDRINCVLLPCEHPLASRSSLSLHDLRGMPFLWVARDFQPAMYDMVFNGFARAAFQPVVERTYEGLGTLWTMVAAGAGWSLGFDTLWQDTPRGLCVVKLDDFSLPWGLDALHRADESRTSTLMMLERLVAAVRTPAQVEAPYSYVPSAREAQPAR